ncbi:M4 family metallopeptidase [Streptacidiphilus sp. P02-A3a]|uniref:M4 family metallopeptidase n=1 Tax=Streptacidiphilus sp. P02-A3a TaxID=2704468 RepID=UPI0015FE5761|nr:M4 family metallopeptidase [Streptacidiphilus sp. P02-A3a]QMU68213.1 peptidase M4 family protein [Streptacidiphilus sp. P02-A3a]
MTTQHHGIVPVFCGIVPPHLLERLVHDADEAVRAAARLSLELDALHRRQRAGRTPTVPAPAQPPAPPTPTAQRTIHDGRHQQPLPGPVVRTEGSAPVADQSVDRAYDGLGDTFTFYLDAYGRRSVDGRGLPLEATVHHGVHYDNAFWNGRQMVFGDGDGVLFNDFTVSVDVIGHELTHGVTQYTANLDYQDQSGALNESVSDVFGSMVKQFTLGQTAAQADWLIGAGLLAPGVQGVALRSMKAPGTAYDDPRLGADPQPATMSGYISTDSDNGGVHLNSGIPNHAFYLAATAIGGHAWERAGQIWYDVLTGGRLAANADFAAFATATADAARARFGAGTELDAVRAAWSAVGVQVAAVPAAADGSDGTSATARINTPLNPA